MSKTTKIVLAAFAFLAVCFFLLLSLFSLSHRPSPTYDVRVAQAPAPPPGSEAPATIAARQPDVLPTPMNSPGIVKRARETTNTASEREIRARQPTLSPLDGQPHGTQVLPGNRPNAGQPVPRPYDYQTRNRIILEERAARDLALVKEGATAGSQKTGDTIDKILAEMDFGNIAFNSPEKMKLNSPSSIQLVLSPTETIENLKKSIVAEGEKQGEQIRISDTMEARLTGTAFQIGAITPEIQGVTGKEVTNWKWEVRPTQYGRHNLHLTLSAVVTVKGSSVPRTIRTFERTIEVEVSSWQRTFVLFRENWEWMWTLVAFPVLGWWLRRRHLKNNASAPPAINTGNTKEPVPLNLEVVEQVAIKEQVISTPTEGQCPPDSATATAASRLPDPNKPEGEHSKSGGGPPS